MRKTITWVLGMAGTHWGWMDDAENDLNVARHTLEIKGGYNWTCFQAQQAAEKAVKAALIGVEERPITHSIKDLLTRLSEKTGEDFKHLTSYAERLDLHYVPPRYPNAHGGRATYQLYGKGIALEAVECAEKIVTHMKKFLTKSKPR